MKKLLLAAVVVSASLFAACSNDRAKVDEINPQDLATKIQNCNNPDSLKLYVQAAKDYAAKLADENKLDSAQAYLNAVLPEVDKKDPSLAEQFKSVEGVIKAAADSAVQKGKDAAAEAASEAVDATKEKAGEVAEAATEAGKEAVDKAGEAGKKAVDNVKDKASEAAQKGVDKAKELFK